MAIVGISLKYAEPNCLLIYFIYIHLFLVAKTTAQDGAKWLEEFYRRVLQSTGFETNISLEINKW